jgi:hypothetical protein
LLGGLFRIEMQVLRTTLDESLAGNDIEQNECLNVRELVRPFRPQRMSQNDPKATVVFL